MSEILYEAQLVNRFASLDPTIKEQMSLSCQICRMDLSQKCSKCGSLMRLRLTVPNDPKRKDFIFECPNGLEWRHPISGGRSVICYDPDEDRYPKGTLCKRHRREYNESRRSLIEIQKAEKSRHEQFQTLDGVVKALEEGWWLLQDRDETNGVFTIMPPGGCNEIPQPLAAYFFGQLIAADRLERVESKVPVYRLRKEQ